MILGICGPDLKFLSISSKYPGSVSDARVWRNSAIFRKFENGYRPFPGCVLIGDAIYPQSDFLVPMRNVVGEMEPFYE
jgi:hypothetical protein